MSTPENINNGINYRSIAENYGYKPVPEGFRSVKPVDLNINWLLDSDQRKTKQYNAMAQFDSIQGKINLYKVRNAYCTRWEAKLDETSLVTNKDNLIFLIEKWYRPSATPPDTTLRLEIKDQGDTGISQFILVKTDNIWNLAHRFTAEVYRGKGIGTQMLKATENCIQAYADHVGKEQEIIIEASQLPVLDLFLRNGYEVIDEDKQKFAAVMSRLEAGDPTLVLASCEEDFQQEVEEKRTWYLFEKEVYERLGDRIWKLEKDADSEEKSNHIRHSIRFKLRKKFTSNSPGVTAICRNTSTAAAVTSLG